jgi:hypothetical protein
MNFIIYFFVVILAYLTLAKSTFDVYYTINTINQIQELPDATLHPPTTIILVSIKSHGTFLPSHYFRLKLVSAFYSSKIVHVKVPKHLAQKYSDSIGLSIYSVSNKDSDLNEKRVTIPGMYFVGNPQLGRWIYIAKEEKWSFYKAYQHLPQELGWENFRPSIEDYKEYLATKDAQAFNSHPQLFGPNGQLTKKFLLMHLSETTNNDRSMGLYLLRSYFNYKQ